MWTRSGQIYAEASVMQTNLFDLHYRGATVYADEVRISQKPRDITEALSSYGRICNPAADSYSD